MDFKAFVNLSHCSGQENRQKALRHVAYILRDGECALSSLDTLDGEKSEMIKRETEEYAELFESEKRIDARLQSRMIIQIPNSINSISAMNSIEDLLKEEFGKLGNIKFTAALHNGHKQGKVQNKHIHVIFSDRDTKTKKKIRGLQDKKFLVTIKRRTEAIFRKSGYSIIRNENQVSLRLPRVQYERYLSGKHDRAFMRNAMFISWAEQMLKRYGLSNINALRVHLGGKDMRASQPKKKARFPKVEQLDSTFVAMKKLLREERSAYLTATEKKQQQTGTQECSEQLKNSHAEKQSFEQADNEPTNEPLVIQNCPKY